MNNQLLQKIQTIKKHRTNALKTDSPEIQEKRMGFLRWICGKELLDVFEMYPGDIYGKKSIPQYLHEIPFANTRTQLKTETRAECDKLKLDSAINLMTDICKELIKNKFSFSVFYAEGQRSPHIIIYNFEQLKGLNPFNRMKARAKFWRWIVPWRFHLLDHSLFDDTHPVPLEYSVHWKHGTPFTLLFGYESDETPTRKQKTTPKKKILTPFKKTKRDSIYYKSCIKCGSWAYLTQGNFYFCTNEDCLFKEGRKC
jgi:hypothetical protein